MTIEFDIIHEKNSRPRPSLGKEEDPILSQIFKNKICLNLMLRPAFLDHVELKVV